MIEAYKIVTGKYNIEAAPGFAFSEGTKTRGNVFKMDVTRTHYDLRKHFFTNRVINIWNGLLNHKVTAESTNQFKIDWINIEKIRL